MRACGLASMRRIDSNCQMPRTCQAAAQNTRSPLPKPNLRVSCRHMQTFAVFSAARAAAHTRHFEGGGNGASCQLLTVYATVAPSDGPLQTRPSGGRGSSTSVNDLSDTPKFTSATRRIVMLASPSLPTLKTTSDCKNCHAARSAR